MENDLNLLMSSDVPAAVRERMSALVDGELETGAVAQICSQWREAGAARSTWHAYQLIGDVMRSEDLGADPAHDAAFLARLRIRLAAEPVVLAPQGFESIASAESRSGRHAGVLSSRGGRRWLSSAVAAGFVVISGALLLTGTPGTLWTPASTEPGPAQSLPAKMEASVAETAPKAPADSTSPLNELPTFVADGQLIRDARLDRYLAAHKQFAGSSALGIPSAFMRNATANAAAR